MISGFVCCACFTCQRRVRFPSTALRLFLRLAFSHPLFCRQPFVPFSNGQA